MKLISLFAASIATLVVSVNAFAQESKPKQPASEKSPAQLEESFKAMLNNVVLRGRWCSVKDGKLGPEKEDKYSIVSASKVNGSKWVISTRIRLNDREAVVPIPVEVQWAGDTAVLIVDNLKYPGGGTYSARVLFHGQTYAGTWSGGDHGGLMNGVIESAPKDSPPRN